MLNESNVFAMAGVKDMDEAKTFYGETLGLKQISDNPAGVMYESGNGRIFVYQTPMAGTNKATTATWEVSDIAATVADLKKRGVTEFERYEFPGVEYDGDIHIMQGMKAAWFKDPSGNILGLSEIAG